MIKHTGFLMSKDGNLLKCEWTMLDWSSDIEIKDWKTGKVITSSFYSSRKAYKIIEEDFISIPDKVLKRLVIRAES